MCTQKPIQSCLWPNASSTNTIAYTDDAHSCPIRMYLVCKCKQRALHSERFTRFTQTTTATISISRSMEVHYKWRQTKRKNGEMYATTDGAQWWCVCCVSKLLCPLSYRPFPSSHAHEDTFLTWNLCVALMLRSSRHGDTASSRTHNI